MYRKDVVLAIAVFLATVSSWLPSPAASFTGQAAAPVQATATVVPPLGVEAADSEAGRLVREAASEERSGHLFRLFHPQKSGILMTLETSGQLVGEFSYPSAAADNSRLEILEQLPYRSLLLAREDICSGGNCGMLKVTIIYTEN